MSMMHLKFTRLWRYDADGDGNVERVFPAGWVGTVDESLGIQAMVEKAAEPHAELTEKQLSLVEKYAESKEADRQEHEQRRELAQKIRADAANMARLSDDENLEVARQEGVLEEPAQPSTPGGDGNIESLA